MAQRINLALRELRFHLSDSAPSAGLRDYIKTNYKTLKAANPSIPLLVREAKNTPAAVYGRFEHGQELHFVADNLSQDQIKTKVAEILKQN